MTCPACQLELRPGLLRCPRCGAPTADATTDLSGAVGQGGPGLQTEVDDRTTFRPRADAGALSALGIDPAPLPAEPVFAPVPPGPMPQVAPVGAGVGVVGAPFRPLSQPASAGARFGAYLLDALILTVAVVVVMLVFGLLIAVLPGAGFSGGRPTGYGALTSALGLFYYLAILVVTAGYIIVGNGRGQTLGKRAVGIAVVDVHTGGPIGTGRSLVRYLMFMVMALPCYLGYLSIPLAPDHRGWHDRAADDVVVTVPRA
jgi:uncharacterized RDD family membrane protein YckC